MSIQDKIFDVDHALEGKPEREDFSVLINFYLTMEKEYDHLKAVVDAQLRAQSALLVYKRIHAARKDDA